MNIAIGNDHAGTEYKQEIKKMLLRRNTLLIIMAQTMKVWIIQTISPSSQPG